MTTFPSKDGNAIDLPVGTTLDTVLPPGAGRIHFGAALRTRADLFVWAIYAGDATPSEALVTDHLALACAGLGVDVGPDVTDMLLCEMFARGEEPRVYVHVRCVPLEDENGAVIPADAPVEFMPGACIMIDDVAREDRNAIREAFARAVSQFWRWRAGRQRH